MNIELEDGADAGNNELAGIIAQAGAIDGMADAATPEAMHAAHEMELCASMAEQNSAAVAAVLELAIPLICPLYPSLEAIYTPDVRARVALVLGPLLAKYGVCLEDMGGKYREEIAAAFVCGPIAIATYKGIKADVMARSGTPVARVHDAGATTLPARPAKASESVLEPGDYGYVEPAMAG